MTGALLGGLFSGCASGPPPATRTDNISGRMAINVAASRSAGERSATLTYDLRGNPEAGQADFSTSLGSVLARARWSPAKVELITEQGERQFADLDSMSREALGEVIPVAALFDWLRGRPWPGAPSRSTATGFEQLGWSVDTSQIADSRLLARRDAAPVVTVRALIDRP